MNPEIVVSFDAHGLAVQLATYSLFSLGSGFKVQQFILSAIIVSLAVGRLIFECFRLISNRSCGAVLMWLPKLTLYILSILFVVPISGPSHCITYWQWTLGVIAMFFGWTVMIKYAAGCPFTGIYVLMLFKMFNTFIKVALLAVIMVIAFGLSFFMIFFEPGFSVSKSKMEQERKAWE